MEKINQLKKAVDDFLDSDEGRRLSLSRTLVPLNHADAVKTADVYLRNRLERTFIAGWDAHKNKGKKVKEVERVTHFIIWNEHQEKISACFETVLWETQYGWRGTTSHKHVTCCNCKRTKMFRGKA